MSCGWLRCTTAVPMSDEVRKFLIPVDNDKGSITFYQTGVPAVPLPDDPYEQASMRITHCKRHKQFAQVFLDGEFQPVKCPFCTLEAYEDLQARLRDMVLQCSNCGQPRPWNTPCSACTYDGTAYTITYPILAGLLALIER